MTVISSTDPKSNSLTMDYNGAESQSTLGIVENVHNTKLLKIISFTLLGITAILGSFILAAVYIQSSSKCVCGFSDQRLRSASENRHNFEPLTAASSDGESRPDSRLPVQLQMDGEAGELMRNNGKGEMNCSVERKTAVQIIASEPKMRHNSDESYLRQLITPYGNITTDPRLIHLTSEKMVITCGKRDKNPKKLATILKIGPKSDDDASNESKERRVKRSAGKNEPKSKKECACDCSC